MELLRHESSKKEKGFDLIFFFFFFLGHGSPVSHTLYIRGNVQFNFPVAARSAPHGRAPGDRRPDAQGSRWRGGPATRTPSWWATAGEPAARREGWRPGPIAVGSGWRAYRRRPARQPRCARTPPPRGRGPGTRRHGPCRERTPSSVTSSTGRRARAAAVGGVEANPRRPRQGARRPSPCLALGPAHSTTTTSSTTTGAGRSGGVGGRRGGVGGAASAGGALT